MAVRTAFLASGIALAVLAQVPGFCFAVVPKGGTSGAQALVFRRDATRFGALPGVCTLSTGRKVKFPNLLELRGADGGHQGGVNGHCMTSPLIDEAEIRAEIDVFGAFEPDLVLLPGQDPMCLDMDFLGSFDADGLGEELVLSDFARFDLRAARLPSRRARGFYYAKLRGVQRLRSPS